MQVAGNTILITGGGSGIGAALAREFHLAGNQVIIAGRRQSVLEALIAQHPGMAALLLDIADEAAISTFAKQVISEFPGLNVLIHNAGIMATEEGVDLSVAEATIATNLLGPIRLTHALLPHLRGQKNAAMITVSSGLAFVPMAATPTYSATKAAIHSWSQSMREQLKGSVEVIEIAPPGVRTELMPGLAEADFAVPLEQFIAEVMDKIREEPPLNEICVDQVQFLRRAAHGADYEEVFMMVNQSR